MTDAPTPTVDTARRREIAPGVFVIDDARVPLVPNIGIVLGDEAALVIDCGMGPRNGAAVLACAREIAGDRRLVLTLTHFHPEHGYGAQAFRGEAEILVNRAQDEELAAKGDAYLEMFCGFGPGVEAALEGTRLVAADTLWDGARHVLDLGGRTVEMRTWGLAHTRGDQAIWLPDARILFTGDLAENRIFPIFPWFPPDDAEIDADRWREALAELEAMEPAIVVPGHGETGDAGILRAVRGYLERIDARVRELQAGGMEADAMADRITAEMTQAHPDWDAPEWIGFAVRYHADRR